MSITEIPRSTDGFIAYGRTDPIMDVEFTQTAKRLLEDVGMNVDYHESDGGPTIDPTTIRPAADWLKRVIP